MFLKKITIKNFRCIKYLTLYFNEGVNILIGENNSGKTTIIDSLRICFSYGKQQRDIYISPNDFHIEKDNPSSRLGDIEFHLFFEIQDEEETAYFNDLLSVCGKEQELQLHFRYYLHESKGIKKVRYKVWGGDNEGQSITPEILDLFYFVYLGALRDAVQCLRPIRGNRIGILFSNLETNEERQKYLSGKIHNVLEGDGEWKALIDEGELKVNEHLRKSSIEDKYQDINIDFLPFEFQRIVDNLRIQIPIYDKKLIGEESQQRYFELYQNGLGYNNLIYTATVLGDLIGKKNIKSESYIALLIEEPEAHLHPQQQNVFFNYLTELNKTGFQTFISSHSPTITAKADLDSLIVLQKQQERIHSLSVKNSDLSGDNKKYLRKFLDVTKSQLFFANGVMLLEGISEALLIPVFSKMIDEKYEIDKKGVELVNVNGIAFEHFANLFNSECEDRRLNCRCVILTDDDSVHNGEESSRAKNAIELKGGLLDIQLAQKTFEYELFISGENNVIMMEIFEKMHPKAARNIDRGNSIEEFATNFVNKVASNKAKSELANRLALRLESDLAVRAGFTIPAYIKEAIKWVADGK